MSIASDSRVVIPGHGEMMLPVNALLGMVGLVSAVVPLTHFAEEPWLLSPAGPAGALEAVFAAGAAKGSALDTHTLTLCHEPEWL